MTQLETSLLPPKSLSPGHFGTLPPASEPPAISPRLPNYMIDYVSQDMRNTVSSLDNQEGREGKARQGGKKIRNPGVCRNNPSSSHG